MTDAADDPHVPPWLRGRRPQAGLAGWIQAAPAPEFSANRTAAAPAAEATEPSVLEEQLSEPPRPLARPPPWHGERSDEILASIQAGLALDVICALHEFPPWAVRAVAAAHRVPLATRTSKEVARLTAERDRLLEDIEEARRRS